MTSQLRLTLRTLLAYLDDILEPAQTRLIGQKVAESDAAQELIARIKQVTRRRRLTAPPATGPGSFDPNTVAEYLDNTLSSELVADVEKACLESDVHLAEIAATHQILTLVLGQPALVPPTAKQRMYALVRGREAIHSRRAPAPSTHLEAKTSEAENRADDDDSILLGLPIYRRQSAWQHWLLPLGVVLVLGGLGVILWRATSSDPGIQVASGKGVARETSPDTAPAPKTPDAAPTPTSPEQAPAPRLVDTTVPTKLPETTPGPKPPDTVTPPKTPDTTTPPISPDSGLVKPPPRIPDQGEAPSKERRNIGQYFSPVGSAPNVLVSRPATGRPWQRLSSGGKVMATDNLVSLPGYRSEVRLESGVHVILWGNVPELVPFPLLESAAVLHIPAPGLDADMTCDRGAFLISNHKSKENEAATVRLRMHGEVWDVTLLEPDAEIGLTLWGRYTLPYNSDEIPQLEVFLFVLKGRATVKLHKVEYRELRGMPDPTVLYWDNKGKGLQGPAPARDDTTKAVLSVWGKPADPQMARDIGRALDELSMRLGGTRAVAIALAEILQPSNTVTPFHRRLTMRCLGAIDAVPDLLDALGDEQKPPEVRIEAIHVLRHWIGRDATQERKLFDPGTRTGFLIDKKYRAEEAGMLLELLHTFSEQQRQTPEFYSWLIDKLRHEKLAIRELAYWHLVRLAPAGQAIPYNPAEGIDQRDKAYDLWKKLIPEGKLPPANVPNSRK